MPVSFKALAKEFELQVEYQRKRRFDKTPKPSAEGSTAAGGRLVLLSNFITQVTGTTTSGCKWATRLKAGPAQRDLPTTSK
jgi:hypothetical protein